MPTIAVLDANVLVPNALCDLLLRLADESVFRPRWSGHILDELRRNVPVERLAIDRRVRFMNAAFPEALVTGYEGLIEKMANHPKDRHVLAAAIACDADRIVTRNLKDFPREACEEHGVEAEDPEDFLQAVLDREPRLVARVVAEQAGDTGRRGPRLSQHDVLDHLARAGAPRFAAAVRPRLSKDDEPPIAV